MTKEELIRMARDCDLGRVCGPLDTLLDHEWEDLHRFAALVAKHEREECAQVCDRIRPAYRSYDHRYFDAATDCAATIRARGEMK